MKPILQTLLFTACIPGTVAGLVPWLLRRGAASPGAPPGAFWLGSALRPYVPEPLAGLAARILNRPAVRRRLVPAKAPRALARHCAEEYTNLAALLPELYERYAAAD